MREETRKNIMQIVLPGIVLFGALAMMYGPSYLRYFRQSWVAYSMLRDDTFGPILYDVELESGFVSETGDEWHVYLLTNLEPNREGSDNRQELVLVDADGNIANRDLETGVGMIQSSHLVPHNGYAMVEVTRHVPGQPFASEVLHYQVTSQQIAMVDSETHQHRPHWDWHHGPHSDRPSRGYGRSRGFPGWPGGDSRRDGEDGENESREGGERRPPRYEDQYGYGDRAPRREEFADGRFRERGFAGPREEQLPSETRSITVNSATGSAVMSSDWDK